MRRIVPVVVIVLTVLAGVAPPAFGMEGAETVDSFGGSAVFTQTTATNASTDAPPGTRLAGSVGVQGAELGGELESRSFDHRLNQSTSNDSKAAVIAQQATQTRTRTAALEAELQELKAARENGSISEQAYRVRAAQLSARASALQRVATQTSTRAEALPTETLRRNGVNVTALRTLRRSASDLTGPEVAAIARGLAGPAAGVGFGPNRANESRPKSDGVPPGRASDDGRRGGDNRPDNEQRSGGNQSRSGGSDNATGATAANGNANGNTTETATDGDHRGAGRGNGQGSGAASDDARRRG